MTDKEKLLMKRLYHIADTLCDSIVDKPMGCDGCWLYNDYYTEEGGCDFCDFIKVDNEYKEVMK